MFDAACKEYEGPTKMPWGHHYAKGRRCLGWQDQRDDRYNLLPFMHHPSVLPCALSPRPCVLSTKAPGGGVMLGMPFYKRFYLCIFKERGGRERGRETSMCKRHINCLPLARPRLGTWPATQACAPTRKQTHDLSVRRVALSPLSHTS